MSSWSVGCTHRTPALLQLLNYTFYKIYHVLLVVETNLQLLYLFFFSWKGTSFSNTSLLTSFLIPPAEFIGSSLKQHYLLSWVFSGGLYETTFPS